MSMPSDTNPDVAEAVAAIEAEVARAGTLSADRRGTGRTATEQIGLAAAALVAFAGIALVGPAITRLLQPKSFQGRVADRVVVARYRAATAGAEARRRSRKAGGRATKILRRLGGGTIRR